jgi:murein DD-endopeptidase MepM/ murein hydrolase activator NlpD
MALVLALALVAAVTSPSSADKKHDLENKQKSAKGKAADAKQDLDESSARFNAAAAALKSAQAKLDAAKNTLGKTKGRLAVAKTVDAQMQAKLERSQADLAVSIARLAKGQAELEASQAAVEEFTVQNIQQGDRGMRAFGDLLSGEDPTTFTEQVALNDSVSDAQLATMQKLAASKVILQINRDKVQKLRDQVAQQRKEAAANLVQKRKLEDAAKTQADQVTALVHTRAKAKSSASALKRQDARRYAMLVRERNSLAAQLRALAQKQIASGGKGSGGDGGSVLSMPVHGNPPITSPYGMRMHPITHVYKLHDGTDFGVPCGTPVYAAASGTVLQEYYNYGYGNRLILNNGIMRGKNIVTTYNHLSSYVAHPGNRVKRGQLIAYSGTTGYSTGCHLHFMVLVNGATVQPMNWL